MQTKQPKDQPGKFSSHEAKRAAILECSKLILQGHTFREFHEFLHGTLQFNENQSLGFINDTKDAIAQATAENNEKVVQTHVLIYEDIFKRFVGLDNATGQMKTMQQKEKLLNLYEDETTEITINTQNNINIESHYDVSKLTDEQYNRFNELLLKAKQ